MLAGVLLAVAGAGRATPVFMVASPGFTAAADSMEQFKETYAGVDAIDATEQHTRAVGTQSEASDVADKVSLVHFLLSRIPIQTTRELNFMAPTST